MNPDEIIAREAARLGRPLTTPEKAAIRGGATRVGDDGITATSLAPESSAARTAREARESAVERDRTMAAITARDTMGGPTRSGLSGGVEDWISRLPSHLRNGAEAMREAGVPGDSIMDWLGEAADADEEEIAGRMRSMGSGAVEGATLGFGDEIAGGLGALTGGDYAATRDAVRRRMEAARAENPMLYGGSALLAGAAVPIPGLGGAAGGVTRATGAVVPRLAAATGRAARAGAAGGAIAGAGMSDANLTEDAAGLLADVGEGAGYGAASGAALGGAVEGAREVARAGPAIRRSADRAVMAMPSRSRAGGEALLEEMGGETALPEAAGTVREVARRAGWFPSSDDILQVLNRDLADGGPSRVHEERLAGSTMDRAELARMLGRRASAGERSAIEAPLMGPLREVEGRLRPPAPAPVPTPRPGRAPAPGPAPARPAPRRAGGPPAPVLPIVPVGGRRVTSPGMDLPDLAPEPTDLRPIDTEPHLPLPEEGTLPRGRHDDDEVIRLSRAAADREAAVAARAEVAEARTGAGRPGAARVTKPIPPVDAPVVVGPSPARSGALEGMDGPPGPRRGRAATLRDEPGVPTSEMDARALEGTAHGTPPAPRTSEPLPFISRGRTRVGPPPAAGPTPPRPVPLGPRPAAPAAGARPRRHAAEGPPVPPDRAMPIYSRPERGSRLRSAPGSALYEMRAARERGFPVPGTRRGPAEHGWRGVGSDLRSRIDEAYRSRFGGPALDEYRTARRIEENEIPIRRSAEAGAARDAGTPILPARDVLSAHVASGLGAGPLGAAAAGVASGTLGRTRGIAIRERLTDAVARGLESRSGRALASGDGSSTRAAAGLAGRGAGMASADRRPAPSSADRALFESLRAPAAEPEPTAAPPAAPPPASSPVPPPAGGATTTRRRARPDDDARALFDSLRRSP